MSDNWKRVNEITDRLLAEAVRDQVEERAAIIEEGDRVSRAVAQDRAARLHGFADWAAYLKSTQPSKG